MGVIVGVVVGAAGRRALTSASFAAVALAALAVPHSGPTWRRYSSGRTASLRPSFLPDRIRRGRRSSTTRPTLSSSRSATVSCIWTAPKAVGPVLADIDSSEPVVFALLSLTVLRMVPVASACWGRASDGRRWWFVGWFGPHGLASLVFALLSLEALGGEEGPFISRAPRGSRNDRADRAASVVAHGFSGEPLAERYGRWFGHERPVVEASGHRVHAGTFRSPIAGKPRRTRRTAFRWATAIPS